MKSQEVRQDFIKLRAEKKSYSYIADKLHISKSTCTAWEKELSGEISKLKKEELNSLYDSFHMTKVARIKELGGVLAKVDTALARADLTQIAPEKLLDFKLKYTEALQKEYIGTEEAYKLGDNINPKCIVNALGNLLDRVRDGEVNTEQANRESLILSNLLKAYDIVELQTKLDALETIMENR